MYTTFLASAFRSIRFGVNEAHGRGIAIQLNYFLDAGAFTVLADGRFTVVPAKMDAAVMELTRMIMTLQAEGSYARAKELVERLGVVRPQVQTVLDRLTAGRSTSSRASRPQRACDSHATHGLGTCMSAGGRKLCRQSPHGACEYRRSIGTSRP